jgi:hypothetical protein
MVEEVVRGMSSQLPGVVVGGLVSLIVAVVLMFVQRLLRTLGELRREVTWTSGGFTGGRSPGRKGVGREFEAKFCNTRDVDIALWDIRLEFYKGSERTARLSLNFADDPNRSPVRVLNLPSKIAISRTMEMVVEGDTWDAVNPTLRLLKEANRAEFVGVIPGGEEIREEIREELKGEPPPWPRAGE